MPWQYDQTWGRFDGEWDCNLWGYFRCFGTCIELVMGMGRLQFAQTRNRPWDRGLRRVAPSYLFPGGHEWLPAFVRIARFRRWHA